MHGVTKSSRLSEFFKVKVKRYALELTRCVLKQPEGNSFLLTGKMLDVFAAMSQLLCFKYERKNILNV